MIVVRHATQCAGENDPSKQVSKDQWNEDHYIEGVFDAVYPVGSVYLAMANVDPGTLFGGTWESLGDGFALVTVDPADAAIDAAGKTTGANSGTPAGSVSAPTFSGTAASLTHAGAAVGDHTVNQVVNHTHAVTVNDAGHNHTQNAHTHTQDAHSHVITSQTATTGAATSYEHGTLDTSSAEAEATETTATAVATNQNATATNNTASTGITATTANPAGGVASITLVHAVTQPSAHAYTPQGTVSAPSFTGNAMSVRQKSLALYAWQRTE